jgi:3-hydroxy-9,10-secoandrosta-1,3,5(10)-triene-9,17-dione monooxygenase
LRDQAFAQYAVGKAQALAESGSLYLRQAIAEVWDTIGRGEEIDMDHKARARRACVQAAESGLEAVDLCCRAAGGAALFESLPFERALRDAHAAMGQIVFQRGAMEDVGRVAFGLAPLSPTF